MCQADGSLAILEVQGSALAGKPLWVQPKNRSQAVNMVLLAADGAPLYPPQTHLHLAWPRNSVTPSRPSALVSGQSRVLCDQPDHNRQATGLLLCLYVAHHNRYHHTPPRQNRFSVLRWTSSRVRMSTHLWSGMSSPVMARLGAISFLWLWRQSVSKTFLN